MLTPEQLFELLSDDQTHHWFFIKKRYWKLFTLEEQSLCHIDADDVNPISAPNNDESLLRIFYPKSAYKEGHIDCHNVKNYKYDEATGKLVRNNDHKLSLLKQRMRLAARRMDFDEMEKIKAEMKTYDTKTTIPTQP